MDRAEIIQVCFEDVRARLQEIEFAIESANNSLVSDTKSSAGDKYETGREMIQQDLNRLQQQLTLANEDIKVLERVSTMQPPTVASVGSLVETSQKNWYFIAIGIGRLSKFPNVYVISPKSPLANLLIGKKVGTQVDFNKQSFTLNELK